MTGSRWSIALLAALAFALACVGPDGGARDAPRVEEVADRGDAQRRASTRLVLDGLDADARGDVRLAQSRYERAIQIDASNPYAYLALARHYVEQEDPDRALAYLDHAGSLFESVADEALGACLRIQQRRFEDRILGTKLQNPDFALLAETFGALGIKLSHLGGLRDGLRDALQENKPTVVEIPVDCLVPPWEVSLTP